MSIGSLGIVGGLAGSALPQRAAEAENAQRDAVEQASATQANQPAEDAAGIGQTEEDSQSGERDADGRRLWEEQRRAKAKPAEPSSDQSPPPLAKDPSGNCGSLLDLVG